MFFCIIVPRVSLLSLYSVYLYHQRDLMLVQLLVALILLNAQPLSSHEDTFSFALSGDYLIQSLINYRKYQLKFPKSRIVKCYNCKKIVAESEINNQKCPKCQESLVIEKYDYEPYGINEFPEWSVKLRRGESLFFGKKLFG